MVRFHWQENPLMPIRILACSRKHWTIVCSLTVLALGAGSWSEFCALGAPKSGPLQLKPSARVVRPGAAFQVTLENQAKEPLFLPGCARITLEKFVGEHFEPLAHTRCDWEQLAEALPPGPKVFDLTAPELPEDAPNGWILRVTAAYGQGCLKERTLSTAQCKSLSSASSPTFILREAPEE